MAEILQVWTQVMNWVTDSLSSVQTVFYANDQLTFLGTLAVVGVSIGIAFLILHVVLKFLSLRAG